MEHILRALAKRGNHAAVEDIKSVAWAIAGAHNEGIAGGAPEALERLADAYLALVEQTLRKPDERRERFVRAALQGFAQAFGNGSTVADVARDSLHLADAVIAELDGNPAPPASDAARLEGVDKVFAQFTGVALTPDSLRLMLERLPTRSGQDSVPPPPKGTAA